MIAAFRDVAILLSAGLCGAAAATGPAVHVVVSMYADKTCTTGRMDVAHSLDSLFMEKSGGSASPHDCQALPEESKGAWSVKFIVDEEKATCTIQAFSDKACETKLSEAGLFDGEKCEKVAAEGAADEQTDDNGSEGASMKYKCTNEAVPEGTMDLTCLTAEHMKAAESLEENQELPKGHCFSKCDFKTFRSIATKESYEKVFKEGGCAQSCAADGKAMLLGLVAGQSQMDCSFRKIGPQGGDVGIGDPDDDDDDEEEE